MTKFNSILSFGETIRIRREYINLSIRQVALKINIDPSLLSKIERNERRPTNFQVELLANCLKINFKQLYITAISDQIANNVSRSKNKIEILKIAKLKIIKLNNEKNTSI